MRQRPLPPEAAPGGNSQRPDDAGAVRLARLDERLVAAGGLSSSDASTGERPGLAAQARDAKRNTARGRTVRRQGRAERPPRTRCVRCWHAAAAAPERGESTSVQPAQRDGARPAAPSAASDGAERYPQPERRASREDGSAARRGLCRLRQQGDEPGLRPVGSRPVPPPRSCLTRTDQREGTAVSRTAEQQYSQKVQ